MLFMHLDPVFTLPAWIAQSPMHLTPKKMTASGHTHGFFVPQFMATWLVPANFQPLNLYWILEKGARRNALRVPAQNFREQSRGPFR